MTDQELAEAIRQLAADVPVVASAPHPPVEDKPPHPEDYRPYNTYPEFMEGYHAYCRGELFPSPYSNTTIAAQAWDRGADYAMRLNRYTHRRGQ